MEVRSDVSKLEREGYVRRDEYLKEGEAGWAPEASLETRKRAPPAEVKGDVYDRQRALPDFDQGVIQRMRCLVLGAGGIGQNVAQLLTRLGVAHIDIVDNDTIDASNLNRQTLASKDDVGRRKVDAACNALKGHNNGTCIAPHHLDVISGWPEVVTLARKSDIIFNGIDIGASFDHCIASLCKEIGIPLSVGQSYGWNYTSEYYSGSHDTPGAWDLSGVSGLFKMPETPEKDKIFSSPELREAMVAEWGVGGNEFEAIFASFSEGGTTLSTAAERYREACLHRIEATQVGALNDLRFLPRTKNVATRFIGSWVVPCMGCAVAMVGQWTDSVTGLLDDDISGGVKSRNPPTYVNADIKNGCTQGETAARQLQGSAEEAGWIDSMPSSEFVSMLLPPLQHSCTATSASRELLLKNSPSLLHEIHRETTALYYGTQPAYFKPYPEEVTSIALGGSGEGNAIAIDGMEVLNDKTPEAADPTLIFPTLPCKPVGLISEGRRVGFAPTPLGTPVIKCAEGAEVETPLRGLHSTASGIRSAIVWDGATEGLPTAFRLKGCGNGEDGCFTTQDVEGCPGMVTPRGCGFANTALTEMRMCDVVAKCGVEVANEPCGLWVYGQMDDVQRMRDSQKCCGVFKTMGDKRAGDHLLEGLLRLFPLMVPASQIDLHLAPAVQKGRGADPSDDIMETDMVTACQMPVSNVPSILSDGFYESPPERWCDGVPKGFSRLWNEIVEVLHKEMDQRKRVGGVPSALLHVAQRVGWECGDTMRAMGEHKVSWGTFTDSLGTHCNAHANNMVVKVAGGGVEGRMLAALDFDMAFDEKTYVASAGGGLNGFNGIDDVIAFERTNGMRQALSGSSFASTGVANTAKLPDNYPATTLRAAFYDTIVSSFDAGLAGSPSPYTPHMGPICDHIAKLALILTSEVVA